MDNMLIDFSSHTSKQVTGVLISPFLMYLGCVELLLEIIHPFLLGSSPLLSHALKIVEILGAYR